MNIGVFIGRFQPLHVGHLSIISHMQKNYQQVIILVGSANQRASIKNPFSFEQRKQWLETGFHNMPKGAETAKKIDVLPLNDYRYNEAKWEAELKAQVISATNKTDKITLVGYEKDNSSYYLKSFPQWSYEEVPQSIKISATPIRNAWFNGHLSDYSEFLPDFVEQFLNANQADYQDIFDEYFFLEAEKKKFRNYPYPETLKFCTTDSLVLCDGKILLVKRGMAPGKNCWALPGGYVNKGERFLAAAIRELYEETSIEVNVEQLQLIDSQLFDDPKRSFGFDRISVGHYFKLDGKCPKVTAGDDAAAVKWVETSHIKNIKMFDDHGDIIDHFLDIL